MKTYFIRLSNQHENIWKFILFLVTVLLIVVALPKETQFNYTFQMGKPWGYDNLLAPFDFPINKTEAELNEEKAAVLKSAHPFYRFNTDIGVQKEHSFEDELKSVWTARFNQSTRPEKEK